MRYLGIDPGLSNTGIAISYEGKIAVPLVSISEKNFSKLVKKISTIVTDNNPQSIIVGFPSHGPIKRMSQKLKNKLELIFPDIKMILHNEDLSSGLATKMLSESSPKKKRKLKNHIAAAALILEDFLLQFKY
jgi:putative holliday junction resolvase